MNVPFNIAKLEFPRTLPTAVLALFLVVVEIGWLVIHYCGTVRFTVQRKLREVTPTILVFAFANLVVEDEIFDALLLLSLSLLLATHSQSKARVRRKLDRTSLKC